MKNQKTLQLLFILILFIVLLNECTSRKKDFPEEQAYRKELAAKLCSNGNEDSLKFILQQFIEQNNDVGTMICHKRLGLYLRENARLSEAITNHHKELTIALKLEDTIEIIQALNNLGTDFRLIGAQNKAAEYHFQALEYADVYAQTHELDDDAIQNRAISLNGIGNATLTLGFLEEAEKYFRKSLQDEIKLKSPIGQAINYANLGSIFEQQQHLDSAQAYYNKSMEQNRMAKFDKGIGLCFIHLGNLYEKKEDYTQAKANYLQAYKLMDQISDKWHWLEACLSAARIYLMENNTPEFNRYIELAEKTATQINSPEHLAKVHSLKYDYFLKQRDYHTALQHYILHKNMKDSVRGIQKINRFLDIRVGYEQDRSTQLIERIKAESETKQKETQLSLYIIWALFVVSLITAGAIYYVYRQHTRSNKILKQLERTRTDFFTNITHEFRTQLTIIQGFNRLLRDKSDLSEKEKQIYRDTIEKQSNNLLNLVNQLLDVARLKSGKDTPLWQHGDIISYLQMTAETFKLLAKEKDVNLIFVSDIESQKMDFIPFYMDKVVSNLLSNAIKYTQSGDKIIFSVVPGNRAGTITIRVTDTGEGIPEEDLKHLFELFYQSAYARNSSGSGIGLSFTRIMVEKMKGRIDVKSKLGKGTTFTITLPLTNKNLPNIIPLKEHPDISSTLYEIISDNIHETGDDDNTGNKNINPYKSLILIVEDNKDVVAYIKSLLRDKYSVITARNGQKGFELAEKYVPDLVITDLMMPIKDGNQFCCEMKKSTLLNHIPIIMLTAKNCDEDRIEGLRCGAEVCISKPFLPKELLFFIENVLENRRILKEKYRTPFPLGHNGNRHQKRTNDPANDLFLLKLNDLIYRELKNSRLTPSFIADDLSMSPSQLNRKLQIVTGHSTSSYIMQMKLNHAQKMLSTSSLTVTEIAETCGFYDVAYFSRTFKKHTGMSPIQFQRSLQKD